MPTLTPLVGTELKRAISTFALSFGLMIASFSSSAFAESKPNRLTVESGVNTLVGKRSTCQLLATGFESNGAIRDVTREVQWTSLDPAIAVVDPRGRVEPRGNGKATIAAKLGDLEVKTTLQVERVDQDKPVSFRNDVVPSFSQAGCNMGSCHGTPTGKGGFRLSLRGYLPDQDYWVLSREAGGRRINPLAADSSMILTKPLGITPHEGGLRLKRSSKSFQYLHDWISQGAKDDPAAPKALKLEIHPGSRVFEESAVNQQLAVVVRYADGTVRDVTPICYYNSSSTEIADVDADGHVTFKSRGEVAVIAHYQDLVANVRLTHLIDVPGYKPVEVPRDNVVDRAVYSKLNRMRIAPSEPCTDREFIRRLYLDVLGVLPSPDEVARFTSDPSPDRRSRLIESTLDRPEFYDFWTLKFADILRSNGRLIQPKGAYVYNRWIRDRLERDEPIDSFVRDLLTADGSTFKNPAANYYRVSRDPENSVETTAQLFLGVRIQCAKCHNHPFERWTQDDYYGFAAFFSGVRHKKGSLDDEEVVFESGGGEVRQPRSGRVMKPKALGGPEYADGGGAPRSRRVRLAGWLTSSENPFFAKSLVNRIWYHIMARGIVEPVDDFRDSNPPSNDELLDGLAAEFVKGGFHLKPLIRLIVSSRTYQASARTCKLNADDSIYFSHSYTKLLPAEVLLDAISTLTGSSTSFNGLPRGARATQIPDGKMENAFLKTFGRPARELACECERESDSNLSQALQLIGGETVNGKLRDDAGRLAKLAASDKTPEAITRELYEIALSREPNATELAAAVKHLSSGSNRRQAVEDLGWVLINSKEFLFRH